MDWILDMADGYLFHLQIASYAKQINCVIRERQLEQHEYSSEKEMARKNQRKYSQS